MKTITSITITSITIAAMLSGCALNRFGIPVLARTHHETQPLLVKMQPSLANEASGSLGGESQTTRVENANPKVIAEAAKENAEAAKQDAENASRPPSAADRARYKINVLCTSVADTSMQAMADRDNNLSPQQAYSDIHHSGIPGNLSTSEIKLIINRDYFHQPRMPSSLIGSPTLDNMLFNGCVRYNSHHQYKALK